MLLRAQITAPESANLAPRVAPAWWNCRSLRGPVKRLLTPGQAFWVSMNFWVGTHTTASAHDGPSGTGAASSKALCIVACYSLVNEASRVLAGLSSDAV